MFTIIKHFINYTKIAEKFFFANFVGNYFITSFLELFLHSKKERKYS